MSRKTKNRDVYFEKEVKPAKTAEAYLNALRTSPYRTHRRMAVALTEEYNELRKEQEQNENT